MTGPSVTTPRWSDAGDRRGSGGAPRRRAAALLAAVLVALSSGCTGEMPTVEIARVVADGEAGTTVLMITSLDFLAAPTDQGGTEIAVLRADSVEVTLPLDRTFDLTLTQRFLVVLKAPDEEATPAAAMRVLVDGELKYDDSSDDLLETPLQFAFVFNRSAGDSQVQF